MVETVAELERKLAEAKKREALAKTKCTGCGGRGFFSDTTYDRTGVDTQCGRCYGTGLPKSEVKKIINDALAPYRRVGVSS